MRSAPSTPLKRVVLTVALVMAATCVAQAFGRFTWSIVLPEVRDDLLGGSNTVAGFFGTLNLVAYLAGTLGVAWLTSRLTLVALARMGLSLVTLGLALAAVAPAGWALALALVLMGAGGAAIWIPAPALVAGVVSAQRRGGAVGLVFASIGIGIVLTGQLAAYLGRRDSVDVWQTVYRVEFLVALATLASAMLLLRGEPNAAPATAGGFGGFSALRTVRGWRSLTLAYASFGFSYMLVTAFFVARLRDDAGISTSLASSAFTVTGLAGITGGMILGPLSDRFGTRITLTGVCGLSVLFTLMALSDSLPVVFVGAAGIGVASSGVPAVISAHMLAHTDARTYGPAFSAATLAFGVMQMAAPQVGGAMADALGSFTWVFLLSAAVRTLGTIAAACLPNPEPVATVSDRVSARVA